MPHARGAHPFNYLLYAAHTRHTMRDRLPRSQCKIIRDPRGRRDFKNKPQEHRPFCLQVPPRFVCILVGRGPGEGTRRGKGGGPAASPNRTTMQENMSIPIAAHAPMSRQLHPWFQVPGSRAFLFSGSVLFVCNGRMSVNSWTGGLIRGWPVAISRTSQISRFRKFPIQSLGSREPPNNFQIIHNNSNCGIADIEHNHQISIVV